MGHHPLRLSAGWDRACVGGRHSLGRTAQLADRAGSDREVGVEVAEGGTVEHARVSLGAEVLEDRLLNALRRECG